MSEAATWEPVDEGRHAPADSEHWHEGWTFDFWLPSGAIGGSTALVLWPRRGRAWYWAALVQTGEPLLYLADLDVDVPRRGLEIRGEGLWASHICEDPFEQWTVANEAHAVALDDPVDALGRAHGRPAPVAFDVEWYASAAAAPLAHAVGYSQSGDVHAVIELAGGPIMLEASARRAHWWGTTLPWAAGNGTPMPSGPWSPLLLETVGGDAFVLDRVLTPDGWWEAISPR